MNRTILKVRINQRGNDSKMWYTGMLGKEFTVLLASGASHWDEEYLASGWAFYRVEETKNGIELTDADVLVQYPNLVKYTVGRRPETEQSIVRSA